MSIKKLTIAIPLVLILTATANANPITCTKQGCSDWNLSTHHNTTTRVTYQNTSKGERLLPHPEGCPRRAFCGCGVAKEVFKKLITRGTYAIAAYWKRLPRTSPAPGMVAIWGNHHVALIKEAYGDGTALLYDPNSGGHKTRLWVRSIKNAVIVNPHGATASN